MKIRKDFEGNWIEERHFLNKIGFHSTAAILSFIRIKKGWINSELSITDCERKVELDVSVHNREARENTVHKLRLIASVCTKMADWIEGPGKDLLEQIEKDNNAAKKMGSRSTPFESFDDY